MNLKSMTGLILIALLWVLPAAQAQTAAPCPPLSACLSWAAPTSNTDGSPLTTLAGYTVSYGQAADALVKTAVINSPTTLGYTVSALTPGTWYFTIDAFNTAGAHSAKSNTVSKVIPASVPAPPTNLAISANLTAYTLIKAQGKLALVPVGTIHAGVRCDATQSVIIGSTAYYPVAEADVTYTGTVTTVTPLAQCS